MNDLPLYLRSLAVLYWDAVVDASKALLRGWLIIPASIAAYIAFEISAQLVAPFGFAGGFLLGLVQIALLTLFYSWLQRSRERSGLSWKELIEFDGSLFIAIINAAFILFIAKFLAQTMSGGSPQLPLFLQLGIVVIFNALPETIMVHRYPGIPALTATAEFVKSYWIEWFLPLLVVTAPILFLSWDLLVWFLANSEELLPIMVVIQVWPLVFPSGGIVLSLLTLALGCWFMLFRLALYQELEGTSMRSRIYKLKQR